MSARLRNLVIAACFCAAGASIVGAPAAWAGAGDDARVVAVTHTVAFGATDSAAIRCDPGERAVGGGVGFTHSYLVASTPLDEHGSFDYTEDGDIPRYWYSEVFNYTGSQQTNTFYAICSASSDATIQVGAFTVGPAFSNSQPQYGSATVACPSGQRALSGGLNYRDPRPAGSLYLVGSGPENETQTISNTENGDAPRFWAAEAENADTASGETFSTSAVCSPTSQATVRVWTQILLSGRGLACPSGSRATGGGMLSPDSSQVGVFYSAPTDGTLGPNTLVTGEAPVGWLSEGFYTGINSANGMYSAVCDPATPPPSGGTSPPPEASPSGKRAAALAKCKKKGSKKARKRCRKRAKRLPV